MIKGIYLTGRSLNARMKNTELIGNNLANINSTGFKRQVPFSEVLSEEGKVQIREVTDHKSGTLMQTTNPLDLAISGEGFFLVETSNGNRLTKDGNFKISQEGFLVNQEGNKVLTKDGPLNVNNYLLNDKQQISITNNGEITIGDELVTRLMIVQPSDRSLLTRMEGSEFSADNSGYQESKEFDYTVHQGYLEESNVNAITEMENMIKTNSEYESAYKIMQSLDQSLEKVSEIGRV